MPLDFPPCFSRFAEEAQSAYHTNSALVTLRLVVVFSSAIQRLAITSEYFVKYYLVVPSSTS